MARLVNIWEDTVDLRELLVGMATGAVLGFAAYRFSLGAFTASMPGGAPGLIKGYALMGGIPGCVCPAVVVAMVVKPKRHFTQGDDEPIDRAALVRALALDPDEERRGLETASPKLILEMQDLQIYDLFVEVSRQGKSDR